MPIIVDNVQQFYVVDLKVCSVVKNGVVKVNYLFGHTNACTHAHIYMHAHTHTYTHTHTHTHTHTRTHTHTHTHTHTYTEEGICLTPRHVVATD